MTVTATTNDPFIHCWNAILTPKWIRFRHLLSGNGKLHSDPAFEAMALRAGYRVLDIACGFGETCHEIAERVGPTGSVLGVDCTESFLRIAERERAEAAIANIEFRLDDIETCQLPAESFDAAFSRFGTMYSRSPVRTLRNVHSALVPGGQLHQIVWRGINDNPCWGMAEQIALQHLPEPDDDAQTCGPGPFSMANEDTDRLILDAAGFIDVELRQHDTELCVGTSLAEAIDYQLAVGPSGYIIREAGEAGRAALPVIREHLMQSFRGHTRSDGSVWLPSSTWAISASKPR